MQRSYLFAAGLFLLGAAFLGFGVGGIARAADHGDAPNVASDQACDLADLFVFLDPNDNTKVIIELTFRGFIVPGEAVNFTAFDKNVLYRIQIENNGDARPDQFIDVTFSPRTAANQPQIARIKLPGPSVKNIFTAPTTVSTQSATAPNPTITTDANSGVSFFAGEVDDPFFFDIPAFSRFIASVGAGSPDPTVFNRARDTFAGYNILTFALSVPRERIRGAATNNIVGFNAVALRQRQNVGDEGIIRSVGRFRQVDRAANPAVNVALIPFARKDQHNSSTTVDDANGKFASSIIATLQSLGTDQAHINTLAGLAVTKGDFERLDLSIANTGNGGGTNAAAAFPNGRRLGDDVIDTLLTIIANGTTLGDNVNGNDVTLRNTFPFFAPPHQPLANGVVDDNTRN